MTAPVPRQTTRNGRGCKSAEECIAELGRAVRSPKGCTIALREVQPSLGFNSNWIASISPPGTRVADGFAMVVAEFKRKTPLLDWDGVTEREGRWRCLVRRF
jgi:hypothetical protein